MDRILKGGFKTFRTPEPKTAAEWDSRKADLRERLWRLLGDIPPAFTPQPVIHDREARVGYVLESFSFDNGVGDTVYGYLLLPDRQQGPLPAVLYHHFHGQLYERGKKEVLTKRAFPELDFAPGEELVRQGWVVLCIDAYCFGQRRSQGPAGEREQGAQTEASLFKTFLWEGRTLWGMMVRDDLLALNYLVSRPEVDAGRIAATGMSMGATRTWWLAALDERIKVAVSVACLTRCQNLIAHGSLGVHGLYYFVPNPLRQGIDTESIVGLIAPRAHLTLTGDRDDASPADGVRIINTFAEHVYACHGRQDQFRGVLYRGIKHAYTKEMWRETIAWLSRHL